MEAIKTNGIKGVVLGICFAAVCIGVFRILSPDGAMSKPVKFTFSAVFLLVFVSSFFASLPKIQAKSTKTVFASTATLTSLTNSQIEYICRAALKDKKVSANKIEVDANISDNGGIYINKLTVYTAADAETVKEILKDIFKLNEVEVING